MIRSTVILVLAGGVAMLSAQRPSGPGFEVASVKRNDTAGSNGGVGLRPNGYAAENVLLRTMIVHAYGLKRLQVVGGPGWIDAERFDVQARAPQDASEAQLFAMVRALLADRFKLAVHTELRDLPIYALVPARDDRRLGPQLKASTVDCGARSAAQSNPCGLFATSFGDRGGAITTKARPLADLASALGGMLDRTAVDRTGLAGLYEFDLKWGADTVRTSPDAPAAGDVPTIFSALPEQLGLKLEPGRGPVEVLVIDSVERPTPD